jgi:hypothetical protein
MKPRQAIEDYRAGRLGTVPAEQLPREASREQDCGQPPPPGTRMSEACSHLDEVADVAPSSEGCEDCVRIGGRWVHLRMCMSCGHVGCCDNSPHRHATAHFTSQQHPVIQSYEPGEDWWFCYLDDLAFVVDDAPSFEHP